LFIPSVIYGFIVFCRNFLFDKKILKSQKFDIPIICVGNITVGGTGKTPHTEFLIRLLKDDFNIAVLSRGYKRKTKGFRLVEFSSNFSDSGDEPLQIKRKFPNIIVAVCENRVVGIEKLIKNFPNLDCVILDDGFQHRKINPSFSILLNNYNRQFTKDYLLPLGKLRDCKTSYKRADYMIFSKCHSELSENEMVTLKNTINFDNEKILFSYLKYQNLINVFNSSKIIDLSEIEKFNILLITGIAESDNLKKYLEKNCKSLTHLKFSDHHNFYKKNIEKINNIFEKIESEKIILMTEKDSIKFINFEENLKLKNNIYYIPIIIEIFNNYQELSNFKTKIINHVRKT
jgi:tetraacyldisaccharide 4'-kinase